MKENAHTIQTRLGIAKAFMNLLTEHPFSDISAVMICQKADIHKATFYRHYASTNELRQNLENGLLERLDIKQKSIIPGEETAGMVRQILEIIRKDHTYFNILISPNFESNIPGKIRDRILEKADQDYPVVQECIEKEDYIHRMYFFMSGCIGVLEKWIQDGCVQSPEEILTFLRRNLYRIFPEFRKDKENKKQQGGNEL